MPRNARPSPQAVKLADEMFAVAAYHPAFLMRQRARLWGVFDHAVQRAVNIAHGTWKPNWREGEFILRPSVKRVVEVLDSMHGKRVAYDVETDGKHPLECTLRCLAFYDGDQGICIPFVTRDGTVEEVLETTGKGAKTKTTVRKRARWVDYWKPAELKVVAKAIQRLFSSGAVAKDKTTTFDSQNGQYDRMVLGASGFKVPRGGDHFDCIIGHHVIASYLPHSLGFLASLYTEVPYYKSNDDGDSWSSESDHQLWLYNIRDVKVTWLVAKTMRQEVRQRSEDITLYEHDAWQEGECEDWKRVGVELDPPALGYFRKHYRTVAARALEQLKSIAAKTAVSGNASDALKALLEKWGGEADESETDARGMVVERFNPGSLKQLRAMLVSLGIPLTEMTATGELSTAKEFLTAARKELLERQVPADDDRLAFLDYLFAWRESTKVEGTYLRPEVLADGRVHPTFSVHVVPTGRLSSQRPNWQNCPAEVRGMYVARPGHILVYGDWDALEMRLAAFISEDPALMEVFRLYDAKKGPKPHIANMAVIFGLPATKEAADQNPGMYRAAKVFAYAVAYGAGDQTVFEQVREELPDMDWKTFLVAINNYRRRYKVMFDFFKNCVTLGTQRGFLESAILKRRVYFFERGFGDRGSPEASAMQNMPMQAGGADVVSLANRRVMEKMVKPMRKKLLKGEVIEQLAQVHDELLFEVPERLADEFKKAFEHEASKSPAAFPHWNLPVEVKKSKRWKPVQARCMTKKDDGTKCKNLIDIERDEARDTDSTRHWAGKCDKCGEMTRVDVEREFERIREAA